MTSLEDLTILIQPDGFFETLGLAIHDKHEDLFAVSYCCEALMEPLNDMDGQGVKCRKCKTKVILGSPPQMPGGFSDIPYSGISTTHGEDRWTEDIIRWWIGKGVSVEVGWINP